MGVFTRFLTVHSFVFGFTQIFRFSIHDRSYQFTAFPLFTMLVDGDMFGSERTHHDPPLYRPFLFIALPLVLKENERK